MMTTMVMMMMRMIMIVIFTSNFDVYIYVTAFNEQLVI